MSTFALVNVELNASQMSFCSKRTIVANDLSKGSLNDQHLLKSFLSKGSFNVKFDIWGMQGIIQCQHLQEQKDIWGMT